MMVVLITMVLVMMILMMMVSIDKKNYYEYGDNDVGGG